MKYIRLILVTIFALWLASCSKHKSIGTIEEPEAYRHVTIVYMAAENSLSQQYYNPSTHSIETFSELDLTEMRAGHKAIPEDCCLAVYMDDINPEQKPYVQTITKSSIKNIISYPKDHCSADSTVMRNVLRDIIKNLRAKSYSLVLWSHATGWSPGKPRKTFGIDNNRNTDSNTGTEMPISGLRWALQQTGVHWDWILFDACFMQCIEVAYELRTITDWTIGSPAEIPGDGAPYDKLMPYMFQADAAQHLVDTYHAHYANNSGVLLSAVDCNNLEPLRNITRHCMDTISAMPRTNIQHYCSYSETNNRPEFYDISSAMHKWLCDADYQLWRKAFEQAVPYRKSSPQWITSYTLFTPSLIDPDYYGGLSFYFPIEGRYVLNAASKKTAFWR